MNVEWTVEALGDARRLYEFLALRDGRAAINFRIRLFAGADGLAVFPARGRLSIRPGLRELVVGDYILIYEADADRNVVTIARVFHGREKR
ncbi:MAG: type II toxin-antitoxin system RelE/ParE family toxin [Tagaea sp.]|jgi:plasmid stabilization system protein ParE